MTDIELDVTLKAIVQALENHKTVISAQTRTIEIFSSNLRILTTCVDALERRIRALEDDDEPDTKLVLQ